VFLEPPRELKCNFVLNPEQAHGGFYRYKDLEAPFIFSLYLTSQPPIAGPHGQRSQCSGCLGNPPTAPRRVPISVDAISRERHLLQLIPGLGNKRLL